MWYISAPYGEKSRDASPLPLRPIPVPAPVCAALLRWMGGFGGSFDEKYSRRFDGSEVDVVNLSKGFDRKSIGGHYEKFRKSVEKTFFDREVLLPVYVC